MSMLSVQALVELLTFVFNVNRLEEVIGSEEGLAKALVSLIILST